MDADAGVMRAPNVVVTCVVVPVCRECACMVAESRVPTGPGPVRVLHPGAAGQAGQAQTGQSGPPLIQHRPLPGVQASRL